MAGVPTVKELIDAGMHFGHRARNWNPKFKPYLHGANQGIHIINLKETLKGFIKARRFIESVASKNGVVLFVGTKQQSQNLIEQHAQRVSSPFVSQRWLGGALTNYTTIRTRLKKLQEVEDLKNNDSYLATLSKKEVADINRQHFKLNRNLSGIRTMDRLPNLVVMVDPKREHNAVMECRRLNIPTIALTDSDSDPTVVDIPIPGNDDSIKSITLFIQCMADGVEAGRLQAKTAGMQKANESQPAKAGAEA